MQIGREDMAQKNQLVLYKRLERTHSLVTRLNSALIVPYIEEYINSSSTAPPNYTQPGDMLTHADVC